MNGNHLFMYCNNNNPVMGMDPTGHFMISALIISTIIGIAIGAGAISVVLVACWQQAE